MELELCLEELESPSVLVDLDILMRNLQHTAELARNANVKLRPHFKTHKSIWIAKKQLELGACGFTVAKLGEAEILVEAGIENVLIAFPIIGKAKLKRLAQLIKRTRIIVSTDNVEIATGLSELGQSLGCKIPLYIDVNTGLNRCGMEPGEETAALVKRIARLPGVEVIGLMTHGGYAYGQATLAGLQYAAKQETEGLVQTKQMLEREGIHIAEISVGSTPTSKFIGEQNGVTEMRPGAYVYGDGMQLSTGIITLEECALSVMATVVSVPRKGTVIIDAGSKTFSSDLNPHRPGYGVLKDNFDVYIERVSEEHGIVRVPEHMSFQIGDILQFLPNHCCATTNLHNYLSGIRIGRLEQKIQVDARGMVF